MSESFSRSCNTLLKFLLVEQYILNINVPRREYCGTTTNFRTQILCTVTLLFDFDLAVA